MKTPRMFSYFSSVDAMRIVAPRPASTRNHLSPARTAVAGPARSGFGRGLPVPRRMMDSALANKMVINDLRPRLQGITNAAQRGSRHPFAGHLLRFLDDHIAASGVQHIGGAEVDAADVGAVVVDHADELHRVIAADEHLFVELFLQS